MVTILRRNFIGILVAIIACGLLLVSVYHNGYKNAEKACEQEKITTIQEKEQTKNQTIDKIRKKTVVERRKDLSRYVIN